MLAMTDTGHRLPAVFVDRGAQPRRQVAHAHADRVVDGVRDRRHRRDDRHLADAAGAKRMPRVGVLDITASIVGTSGATGTR